MSMIPGVLVLVMTLGGMGAVAISTSPCGVVGPVGVDAAELTAPPCEAFAAFGPCACAAAIGLSTAGVITFARG